MIEDSRGNDVVDIREQIDREWAAAWRALHGFAMVGTHKRVSVHIQNVCFLYDELKDHVGEKSAIEILSASMERQAGHGPSL
jgi:hypothetical protein